MRDCTLPDPEFEEEEDVPLERKKERARMRAKAVRESAKFSRKRHAPTLTPGVKIVGSSVLDESDDEADTNQGLEGAITSYIMNRGGFQITEKTVVETLSKKRDSEDVMNVGIARIMGFHNRWGLDRRFLSNSIHAHRFEDGTVIEYSVESYSSYVSRTYYVVDGYSFRAFAQHNYRKTEGKTTHL